MHSTQQPQKAKLEETHLIDDKVPFLVRVDADQVVVQLLPDALCTFDKHRSTSA